MSSSFDPNDRDRRIKTSLKPRPDDEKSPKLKNLAGLIQGLTYPEMKDFAGELLKRINEGDKDIPELLLDVADHYLAK